MSRVMCHMSHVRFHMSGVRWQVSCVKFFRKSVGASRFRFCYQQGLPRLVYTKLATWQSPYSLHSPPASRQLIMETLSCYPYKIIKQKKCSNTRQISWQLDHDEYIKLHNKCIIKKEIFWHASKHLYHGQILSLASASAAPVRHPNFASFPVLDAAVTLAYAPATSYNIIWGLPSYHHISMTNVWKTVTPPFHFDHLPTQVSNIRIVHKIQNLQKCLNIFQRLCSHRPVCL